MASVSHHPTCCNSSDLSVVTYTPMPPSPVHPENQPKACRDLVISGSNRKPSAVVHVAVVDPREQCLVSQTSTETVEPVLSV
ncbi:unnamed protein product [Arctogadus glacialis]